MRAVLVAPPPPAPAVSADDAGLDSNNDATPIAEQTAAAAADESPASLETAPGEEPSTGGAELVQRFSSLWEEMEDLLCPLCDSAGKRGSSVRTL